jgi:hypothetical protein
MPGMTPRTFWNTGAFYGLGPDPVIRGGKDANGRMMAIQTI